MENNAPVPLTAFASVNQSARWNSRIIAKGLFGLRSVMSDSVPHFLGNGQVAGRRGDGRRFGLRSIAMMAAPLETYLAIPPMPAPEERKFNAERLPSLPLVHAPRIA